MAGACPVVIDGSGKISGGGDTDPSPTRKGYRSDFVYDSREQLSRSIGCSFVVGKDD